MKILLGGYSKVLVNDVHPEPRKQPGLTFHYTSCLIGILIIATHICSWLNYFPHVARYTLSIYLLPCIVGIRYLLVSNQDLSRVMVWNETTMRKQSTNLSEHPQEGPMPQTKFVLRRLVVCLVGWVTCRLYWWKLLSKLVGFILKQKLQISISEGYSI